MYGTASHSKSSALLIQVRRRLKIAPCRPRRHLLFLCHPPPHLPFHMHARRGKNIAATFWSVIFEKWLPAWHRAAPRPHPSAPYLLGPAFCLSAAVPLHLSAAPASPSAGPSSSSRERWRTQVVRGKCLRGTDHGTVLGLAQWPWRLIVSPQKCSFMLLILCKLVSDFLCPSNSRPCRPSDDPSSTELWSEARWAGVSAALVSTAVTRSGRVWGGKGGAWGSGQNGWFTVRKVCSGRRDCCCRVVLRRVLFLRLSPEVWKYQSHKYERIDVDRY